MKKTFSMILAVMVLVLCLSISVVSVFAEPTVAPTVTETTVVDLSGTDTPTDAKDNAGLVVTSDETTVNETATSTETSATDAAFVPATGDEVGKLSTDVQTGAGTPVVFAVIAVLAVAVGSVCFIGFKKSKAGK